MATVYVETSQFIESTELPDDGDQRDAAGQNVPHEVVLDRTRYLRDQGFFEEGSFGGSHVNTGTYRISGALTMDPLAAIRMGAETAINCIPARTYVRVGNAVSGSTNDPAEWQLQQGQKWVQISRPVSNGEVYFALKLPQDSIITAATIKLKGAVSGTHAADLLGMQLPIVQIYRTHVDTGVATQIATGTDPSTTKAGYEAIHAVPLTLGATSLVTIDNQTYQYSVHVRGEGDGAGNADGLNAWAPKIIFSRAYLGEE